MASNIVILVNFAQHKISVMAYKKEEKYTPELTEKLAKHYKAILNLLGKTLAERDFLKPR